MIQSIQVKEKTGYGERGRISNLPAVKNKNGFFEFKPGLNIILGSNGSGKSSLIKGIAAQLGAAEYGYSMITSEWLRSVGALHGELNTIFEISHDGQAVYFSDTETSTTTLSLDSENAFASINKALTLFGSGKQSKGEHAEIRMKPTLELLESNPIVRMVSIPSSVKEDSKSLSIIESVFKSSIDVSQPTILLDEPESGLGILSKAYFWELIQKVAIENKFQIIMASHCEQCLCIEGANYIELEEGYREACLSVVNGMPLTKHFRRMSFSGDMELSEAEINVLKSIASLNDEWVIDEVSDAVSSLLHKKLIDIEELNDEAPKSGLSLLDSIFEPKKKVCFFTAKGSNLYKQVLTAEQ